MNNRQKLVQKQFLNNEAAVIKRLDQVYGKSLAEIKDKIKNLEITIGKLQQQYDWMDDSDPEKVKIKSMIQSKIYQKNFQEQLHKQVDGILNRMQTSQFATVSEYLDECYTDGFIGTIFDVHGQGVPIVAPINQEAMVSAVQLESKISKGLYTKLGEDVNLLKKKITAQVSRGISTGMTFAQVAKGLENYTRIGYNKSIRIARTEGHRIQTTATMHAMEAAKDRGADVVKQWDATLDGNTRESHMAVDGEIRELDKPFSNGLDYPGDPAGGAAEVINCRCALLQRAKWALDDDELQTLQDRAIYFGLDKANEFDDFKQKYLKAVVTPEPKVNKPFDPYSFTDDQKDAIEWYVSGDGQFINQYHRGMVGADFGDLSDQEKQLSDLLDEATDRILPDDIASLYRSVDAKAIFGNIDDMDYDNLKQYLKYGDGAFGKGAYADSLKRKTEDVLNKTKGKTITEKGFMSTTKNLDVAEDWGDFTGSNMPLTLEFDNIPRGLKGADLKLFDIGGDEQFEVLLARNTKYKISDIYVKDGQVHVKASFIVDDVADDIVESVVEKVRYSADAFPEAFRGNKQGKTASQIFADTLSDADNLNPNIAKLYTHMDDLPDLPAQYKVSYTTKGHALTTNYYWTGDVADYQLKIPKMTGDDLMGEKCTAFHEMGHFIDKKVTGNDTMLSKSSQKLTDAVRSSGYTMSDDVKNLLDDFKQQYNTMSADVSAKYRTIMTTLNDDVRAKKIPYAEYNKKWNASKRDRDAEIDYLARNLLGGGVTEVSDIYDALSGGSYLDSRTLLYGHGGKYYINAEKRNSEIFANYMSLSVNRPDLVEMIRKDKPDLCNALDELIDEMAGKIK